MKIIPDLKRGLLDIIERRKVVVDELKTMIMNDHGTRKEWLANARMEWLEEFKKVVFEFNIFLTRNVKQKFVIQNISTLRNNTGPRNRVKHPR